jgi:hypothetical protein
MMEEVDVEVQKLFSANLVAGAGLTGVIGKAEA